MKCSVNMNVSLPKPGRKGKVMGEDEFLTKLESLWKKIYKETGEAWTEYCKGCGGFDRNNLEDFLYDIRGWLYGHKLSKCEKDLEKVNFDIENVGCEYNRVLKTKSGVPYIAAWAGGDWESPLLFMLYLDESLTLRGYIPTKGNSFNKDTKSAFGNDEDADVKFLAKEKVYCDADEVEYDYPSCVEDFEARIIPV